MKLNKTTSWNASRWLIAGLAVLAFATLASAQEATIVGTVLDPSGAAVPSVQITVANTDTGVVMHYVSNAAGQYVAPDIHIGHYTVKAEAAGFKAGVRNDLVLQVGDRIRVDFTLEIGATTETINVEATPIAVQADTGEVSGVVTGQEISQIATDGRSVYSLALLVPGVTNQEPGYQAPTSVGGNPAVSFSGQRTAHNLWLSDGAELSDRGGAGGAIIAPSLDALSEFRVMTSNYSSDYGLSSAGTINMVFKSGTKDFHATLWEFFRNNDMDANDFFRNEAGLPTSVLKQNIFGFNIGGPVLLPHYNKERNKTFFFYNMEWRKVITQDALNTVVPSLSEYPGAVASANGGAVIPGVVVPRPLSAAQAAAEAADGLTPGQAFPNNTIPANMINPISAAMLKAGIFPGPNNPAGNAFIGGLSQPTDVREELVRIDHQFNDKLWIFGHFVWDSVSQFYGNSQWSADNVPSVQDTLVNPSWSGVIHLTWNISPTLLSETSFNSDGNQLTITPSGVVSQPSSITAPRLFNTPNNDNRWPAIWLLSPFTAYDAAEWPWHNVCSDWQGRQDFSLTRGSHQMKFGVGWAIYLKQQDLFGDTQGQDLFLGGPSALGGTGNAFGDFLVGNALTHNELALEDHGQWNAVSPSAYFQDNWRVNKRLTLNLGVRWDGIPHTYEANHRMANFYPEQYNPADAAILLPNGTISPSSPGLGTSPTAALAGIEFYTNGMGITGKNGNPNGMVANHWNNFGPRIGFAYDLTGSGKTIVRGGFGAMYERIQGNDMYNSGSNPPFGANVSVSFVNISALPTAPIPIANPVALSESDYKNPVTYQYSVGVQHQFGTSTVLQAMYVGNQSRHQSFYTDLNLPPQAILPQLISGAVNINNVVPYIGYGGIAVGENAMNAHYNGLQTAFQTRYKGLMLMATYTYSHSVDPTPNGGDLAEVSNPYNINYDLGPSGYDARNVGTVSIVYDLPFFRHSANRFVKTAIGGWELAGLWTAQSGFPLTVTLGGGPEQYNGLPSSGCNGGACGTNRPDVVGTITFPQTAQQWFTPAICSNSVSTNCFGTPAPGQWGDATKGEIRGPGRNNWNISLFKSFLISEARNSRFELRFESFNTFNHIQFNAISTAMVNNPQFGQPTSAWDPRTLQLAAKLYF